MKRVLYILSIFLVCLLLTVGMLLILLQSSKVQTSMLNVLASEVSRALDTQLNVERLHYRFPNSVDLDGVYVEDLEGDTLLYVDSLRANFDIWAVLNNRICFSNVSLKNSYVNLYTTADSSLNLQFLLDLLPQSSGAMTQTIEVKDVSLENVRFRFDDYVVNDINGRLSLNHFSYDSIDAQVDCFSLREKSGFVLNDLQTKVVITSEKAIIRNLNVVLPHSRLMLNGIIAHTEEFLQGFQKPQQLQFIHDPDAPVTPAAMFEHLFSKEHLADAFVALHIDKGELTCSDIGSFVPQIKSIGGLIEVSGDVKGRIRDIRANSLCLSYRGKDILRGDVHLIGLPRIDTTMIEATVEDIRLDRALIQDFLSDFRNSPFMLPSSVANLGVMHYAGVVKGRVDSLHLDGALNTKVGQIKTVGSLIALEKTEANDSTPILIETMEFRGAVSTHRFALGRLLGQKDIGNVAMSLQVDAITGRSLPLKASLSSVVSQLQLRGYTYRNIRLNGRYSEKEFEGDITVNDENLQLSFSGLADLTGELPVLNFDLDLDQMNFAPLNLSDKFADATLRARVSLNGSGNSLDNVNGYLYVDSLLFTRMGMQLPLDQLRIYAETGENEPTNFKIQSDYVNANFSGNYKYSQLPLTLARVINRYMPQMLSLKVRQTLASTEPKNDMHYYIYFKNLDRMCEVFDLPVSLSKAPTIKGYIDEKTIGFGLQVVVPNLKSGNLNVKDITLNMDNQNHRINLGLYGYLDALPNSAGKQMGDLEAFLRVTAKSDSLHLGLDFNNLNAESVTAGSLRTTTHFSQYAGFPLIDVHVKHSDLIIADSVWTIGDSHLIYSIADTSLQVNNFSFGNLHQWIYADGLASKRETDSIHVRLQNIDLDYILSYTKAKGQLSFGGDLTGWATAYGLFNKPMFEAEVWMDSATFNGTYIGDAHGVAYLNKEQKTIDINADIVESHDTVATLLGTVYPLDQKWQLDINADSTNIGFINFWTQGIIDDIEGRAFGWVQVSGVKKEVRIKGKALAKDAAIGVDMIGARLYFTDSVTLDVDKISFKDIHAHDAEGNELLLDGVVTHDGAFKDLAYDINAEFDNVHVMNLPAKAQDMFYGQVYASGMLHIKGDEAECHISANARTMPNTHFYLNIATASNASDNSFITFVDHHSTLDITKQTEVKADKRKTKILLDLQIEATRDALVNLIIDPRTGDEIQARGEGNIRLNYDVNANDIKLFGTYVLESGKLYFTLENLLRKEFTIRQGSQIMFSGDPLRNLQIDASAQYSTTASLRDLFGTDYAQLGTNRSSVPVNCIIYLKDNLLNPLISFGIEMPQSDESVANQVHSIINTDEMMLREIMYLLVFNRFYTPEYLQSSTSNGVDEMSALVSSTVTGQINNWLRKLTNNFTIGFNFRTDGTGSESAQEYETQFQYQPNSRLLINGNFGYRYNDIANQPVFGNLDVEYILSPTGHWRARAYTHTVDKYSLREAHTVQGVGLIFKYDFNRGDTKKLIKTRRELNRKKREQKHQEKAM